MQGYLRPVMTVASRLSIASPTLEVPFKKLLAPCWMSLLPPCTPGVAPAICPAVCAAFESNAFLPYLIAPAARGTATAPSTPKKNLSFKFSKACSSVGQSSLAFWSRRTVIKTFKKRFSIIRCYCIVCCASG